jgi:DNA-binding response OmpR family regulator
MATTVGSDERKRILFSDDELDLGKAMKLHWESEGYEVYLAPGAVEALEVARSWQPDLVVTDLWKFGADGGQQLLRWLKADKQTEHIPVLVLSAGCNNPATRQEVLDAGAWAAWSKPFDPRELLPAIRDLLGG